LADLLYLHALTKIPILNAVLIAHLQPVFLGMTTGIGFILFYEGLKRIKAAQAAALELTSLFFAAIFGFLFLHEIPTIMELFGIAALFVGIHFLSKKEKERAPIAN